LSPWLEYLLIGQGIDTRHCVTQNFDDHREKLCCSFALATADASTTCCRSCPSRDFVLYMRFWLHGANPTGLLALLSRMGQLNDWLCWKLPTIGSLPPHFDLLCAHTSALVRTTSATAHCLWRDFVENRHSRDISASSSAVLAEPYRDGPHAWQHLADNLRRGGQNRTG